MLWHERQSLRQSLQQAPPVVYNRRSVWSPLSFASSTSARPPQLCKLDDCMRMIYIWTGVQLQIYIGAPGWVARSRQGRM